jgi:glutamate/tyrosine decarboxylase-like PLP-dependent enzyme
MVELDEHGRMDLGDLERLIKKAQIEQRPILMVVSVAGTTELGQFDDIESVQNLLDHYANHKGVNIWHHVDAAYGGFFCSLDTASTSKVSKHLIRSVKSIHRANSLTLDPHKLGYVPYSSGVTLVSSSREYARMTADVPYVQFISNDPGPYTLEGSRAATGAASTWLTSRVIGLNKQGYGRILARAIKVREDLQKSLESAEIPIYIANGCDTNILCFTLALKNESLSQTNKRMESLYQQLSPKTRGAFTVSKTSIKKIDQKRYFEHHLNKWQADVDEDVIVLARMCLLNPFFGSKEMNFDFIKEFTKYLKEFCQRTI